MKLYIPKDSFDMLNPDRFLVYTVITTKDYLGWVELEVVEKDEFGAKVEPVEARPNESESSGRI